MIKKKLSSDSLIRSGFIILLAYGIYNITNFLYHFLSARMLGPAEYAVVASLFSIIYLVSVGSTTIQNTITKFTADFKAKNETAKIAYLFKKGTKKLLFFSVLIFILYLIASPLIANFLNISLIPVLILSPLLIISILIPLNRGILQGLQKFNNLGLNIILEGISKILIALLLIYLGFKANGAIAAVVLSTIFALIFTLPYLKFEKIKKVKIKFESDKIYRFAILSFTALLLITMIYSVDVFLVKHFLSAELAGKYAALSLLGKIVFFGATAIGIVMFPKITAMSSENKSTKKIFKKSLLFTLIISSIIVLAYFLFSNQIVNIVFGSQYAEITPLLGFFGVFMLLFSLSYICVLNKLAIGKKRFIWILVTAVLLEILLITLYHNSLGQIVTILIALNSILFISLLKESKK